LEVCHVDLIRLSGGKRLSGVANAGCAKNAVLPILAACLLSGAPVTLTGFPMLTDTRNMLRILETLVHKFNGDRAHRRRACRPLRDAGGAFQAAALVHFMMGPMWAISPGDGHLSRRLRNRPQAHRDAPAGPCRAGGVIREAHGMIYLDGETCAAARCFWTSLGGTTENVMMAGVMAAVVTRIQTRPRAGDRTRAVHQRAGRASQRRGQRYLTVRA
jgi:UDP-N-acetylglucosamine 1-carboxyvinyltransferase